MVFFRIVFVVLAVVFIMNAIDVSVQFYLKDTVYACEEVTKADPVNVQKICNRRWRRK